MKDHPTPAEVGSLTVEHAGRGERTRRSDDAGRCVILSCVTFSYARRQKWRRLLTAASRAAGAAIALVAAALAFAAGEAGLGLLLALLSGVFALASRHSLRLAARSRVGAESEAQARRALEPLASEGWHVEHAVDRPAGGDLDHARSSDARAAPDTPPPSASMVDATITRARDG